MALKISLAAALGMHTAVSMAASIPAVATKGSQIVGGEEATEGEFPSIVSLWTDIIDAHFCGGTLLNAHTVITAAHCADGMDPAGVKARAGTLTWNSGGKQVDVAEFLIHPDYSGGAAQNDIALVRLKEPIEEGDAIAYVTLPAQDSDPAANATVTTAGWGDLDEGANQGSPVLMKVNVPIVDRETCGEQYEQSGRDVTTDMFCAGVDEGGKDACQGDSGGPVYDADGVLIGAVSWGLGCARPGFAGVYARVGHFVSWIEENAFTS